MYFPEFEALAERLEGVVSEADLTGIDQYLAELSLPAAQNIVPWKVAAKTGLDLEVVLEVLIQAASTTGVLRSFFRFECPLEGGSMGNDDLPEYVTLLDEVAGELECDVCENIHERDECAVLRFQRIEMPKALPSCVSDRPKPPTLHDSASGYGLGTVADIKSNAHLKQLLQAASGSSLVTSKIRIAFIGGDTSGDAFNQLQVPREFRQIKEAIERSRERESFKIVEPIFSATKRDLTLAYVANPEVLHFSGHGNDRHLAFLLDRKLLGETEVIEPRLIVNILRQFPTRIRLCIFNACNSATFAEMLTNEDIVDFAIGWSGSVEDESAIVFAEIIYNALGNALTLEQAFELAKANASKECVPIMYHNEKTTPSTVLYKEWLKNDNS